MTKKKQSKKNKRSIWKLLLFLLFVLIVFSFLINKQYTNKNLVKTSNSIIARQEKLEKQLITKGYTFDKPNIIIDPYNNSPLTAIILFETKESVKVKITVEGKDELTTLKY